MIDFLNKCVALAPQATTALLNEKNGAVAKELRTDHNIAAVKNAVGNVVGFVEMKAAAKSKPKSEKPKEEKEKPKKISILDRKKKNK
jgi:hypothetical protein